MIVAALPRSKDGISVYSDSVLHIQKLRHPYKNSFSYPQIGILSCLSGNGTCTVNEQHCQLFPDTYVVINSGSSLHLEFDKHSVPFLLYFHPKFSRDNHTINISLLERLHLSGQSMGSLLKELYRLSTSSASFYALKSDALVRSIYQVIYQKAEEANSRAELLSVSKESTKVDLFKRLDYTREFMHVHLSDMSLNLKEMASMAGMNYHHYLRMFNQAFGTTPNQYLIDSRLERAKELLTNSNEPVSSICSSVGYQSIGSFSTLFRTRFGYPPSACREQ